MDKFLNKIIIMLGVIAGILMLICITFIVKETAGKKDAETGSFSQLNTTRPTIILQDSDSDKENGSESSFNQNDIAQIEVPENVVNLEPGPVSEVRALMLADQFANPKGTWVLEHECLEEVDGVSYHVISTTAGRTVYINAATGEIFVATAKYGFQTLEEHFGQVYNHRTFSGSPGYEEGYALFHKYMSTVIDKKDKKTAAAFIDTSYFEETGKKDYQRINEDTWRYFENQFKLIDQLDRGISEGGLAEYELGYVVTLTDEYEDEFGDKWVDIYVHLKYYTKTVEGGFVDWESGTYTVSVKQKGNRWVVVRVW